MDRGEPFTTLPEDDDMPPEGGAAPGDLEQEILAELSEMRAIMVRFARRLDARAETPEGQQELPKLNNAAVKAVQALRRIGVLQLEILGKRPLPNVRPPNAAPTGAPANRSRLKFEPGVPNRWHPDPPPYLRGDYTDYDDYTDAEREALKREKFGARIALMGKALDEDFRAAGREDVCGQSPETKSRLIFSIPHPALDRWVAETAPGDVFAVFGFENVLPLKLGPGPPDPLAAFDERSKAFPPRPS